MKIILLILLVTACSLTKQHSKQIRYMDVFLMNSFRSDSINIKTQVSNNKSFNVTTNLSLGQAKSLVLTIREGDTTIIVKDVIRGNTDSVKCKIYHPYLYVYYQQSQFTFNFSDKLLILE